jgi:hypothetical protein
VRPVGGQQGEAGVLSFGRANDTTAHGSRGCARADDAGPCAETLAKLEKLARDDAAYYANVCRDNAATLRAAATAASTKAEECDRGAEAMERALSEIGASDDISA